MFLRVLYISVMVLSTKQLFRWRQTTRIEKKKKKIEALSNEWDQLTQHVILLEQHAFQEASFYDKSCNDLQAKHAMLQYYQESFDDIKNMMTELLNTHDIKPKEFQSLSGEMLEVISELNRITKDITQLQQDFDIIYADRDEKLQQQEKTIADAKARISQIETELSNLRLSS